MNFSLKSILILGVAWAMAGHGLLAQETNDTSTTEGTTAKSFAIISKRNIFDPNRRERSTSRRSTRTARNDYFTLLGTLSYQKGDFAIFDGSDSDYRKTLGVADSIAGYRIAEITPDAVKLMASSNRFITLPVGTQMRRPQGGKWSVAGEVDTMAPDVAATGDTNNVDTNSVSGTSGTSSGDTRIVPYPPPDGAPATGAPRSEEDAIKRMMKRRSEQ